MALWGAAKGFSATRRDSSLHWMGGLQLMVRLPDDFQLLWLLRVAPDVAEPDSKRCIFGNHFQLLHGDPIAQPAIKSRRDESFGRRGEQVAVWCEDQLADAAPKFRQADSLTRVGEQNSHDQIANVVIYVGDADPSARIDTERKVEIAWRICHCAITFVCTPEIRAIPCGAPAAELHNPRLVCNSG